MKRTGNGKKAFRRQFVSLAVALLVCFSLVFAVSAAEPEDSVPAEGEPAVSTETTETASSGAGLAAGLGFIGAALSIGLAALGAGIALSAGAPAAIGAVAEDPKSFGKSMIFVALGEAVAIYGFIIAFLIILQMPDLSALTAL
ncbi:MAG: hypothetical protein J1E00_04350 [Oscillospiraceae bacterium]|nr:hypothetical protein [Oscillospiraceae bacterium]